ncbi:PhoX domain-containing protein [Laetiporus sulphureus 93-53]|uniref:PhoX domain-containing protein n=1 Tax=Laetiporus sulphureus 93-53 TaxID=1314785 RepID=A0A165FB22_9APHY|nr:PhoX domain-containing protein [Laetiporus sulphureus 93-53]KZT08695.1 PhoX domain-containing protein [Laetiporus sulphureus 93-53]
MLGKRTALFVAILAIVLPVIARVASSPLALALLLPALLILSIVGFFVLNVLLGYALDASRPATPSIIPHAARPLAFSTPAAWQAVLTRSQWSYKTPQSLPPLCPEYPILSSALNDILIMIVRDFVLVWYREISSSPSFPTAVSSIMHDSVEQLLARVMTLDISALIVKRIVPKVTAHIEQFRLSEMALRGAGLERRLTQSEELDLLLASRYAGRGGGKLHRAVDNLSSTFTRQTEEKHLKELIDNALPSILPPRESNSQAVRIVVREIVACSVLYPIMDMLSDPDFWNRLIDSVAGAAIRQQKLVSKVRNVLEAQLPRPRHVRVAEPSSVAETITIQTDARQFESFLRSINRCSSLLDARRLKNDIMSEIRRNRTLLANHEKDDWIDGKKTEDIVAFLDRLYTAKRRVERRIVILGGEAEPRQPTSQDTETASKLSLRDILTNPSSLSYFMEFMDRRQRSLLVQFWLTVESFKNPLESVDSGSSDEEDEPVLDPTHSATLKEDISMMKDLYFSGSAADPVLECISAKHVNTIRSFGLDEDVPEPVMERKVRRSVMLAQRQVEREMEQDFEEFQESKLWFRVIEDIDIQQNAGDESTSQRTRVDARKTDSRSSTEVTRALAPSGNGPIPAMRSNSSPLLSVVSSPKQPRADNNTPSTPGPLISSPVPRASTSNLELFMSPDIDSTSPSSSRAPLFDDPNGENIQNLREQSRRMEAIQAALTDIIALDRREIDGSSASRNSAMTASPSESRKRTGLFEDEPEEDDRLEDDVDSTQASFQLAGPGDLQLSHEINRLAGKIDTLQSQSSMLDTLINKAELTGDAQELRLLRKSQSSLSRELRELNFQKTQYEQQESANRLLSDRTKVSIVNSTVGEEEGKSVVRYLVEVQQLAPDGSYTSGWVVARRYSEFFAMHNKLRERYALVRNLDFPGKRLVTSLSGSFVDSRRVALEKFLQSLIAIPAVCESDELRSFLSRDSPFIVSESVENTSAKATSTSPSKGLVRSVYQSVADSIDDMFFGPSMLDVIVQRLTSQAAESAGIVGNGVHDEELVTQALKASGKAPSEDTLLQLPGGLKPLPGETSSSTFSSPICDLVLSIFELNKKNNWLRRQAIVIILQQVFGDTIERKLRETFNSYVDEPHLMSYINMFREGLWPGGKLKAPEPPRTTEEKLRTRDEANRKLSALMPDLVANMIGRSNARRGARRIFAVLQNRRLNQHLLYTIVDEIFAALFQDQPPP